MEYVYPIVIGLVAGWLASLILGGSGGLLRYLVLGLLGAIIGGILLPKLDITLTDNVDLNNIITATGGAVVLLFVAQLLTGKS